MFEMLKSQTLNKKNIECFLLMFFIVTFHLEIVSGKMTFRNQSMNIHVKDIQKAMKCYKGRKYFKKKQES